MSEQNRPYENLKCPECGSTPMVSRTSKFGVFWGCKDFPNCKGTRDSQGLSKAERRDRENKEDNEVNEYKVDHEENRIEGKMRFVRTSTPVNNLKKE